MSTQVVTTTESGPQGGAPLSASPYPGLRPFQRAESDIFFGRESMVDELLRRLENSRFLGIVGVSGCGKSSLLRAGLIPALETGFLSSAGVRWKVAEMRPGNHPLRRLAEALHGVLLPPDPDADAPHAAFIEATLRRGPLGLVEALRDYELPGGHNLLLIVDQFEEIFRYRSEGDRDEADAFVQLLLATAEQEKLHVFVTLAMRSDYLGQCAIFAGLPEALNESQFLTPRLKREERRAAVEGPAGVFGAKVHPALVNQILNDMGSDPDRLPIMQHLLMRMWTRAESDARRPAPIELVLDDYAAVGGFAEALSRHADEVLATLPDDESWHIAQILFRRITEWLEDKPDSRRPARLADIAAVAAAGSERVAGVIETFRQPGNSFLLPPRDVALGEDSIIDITHESLIRQWGWLRGNVRDEARSADTYKRLVIDARSWRDHEEQDASLLRGPRLDEAVSWKNDTKPSDAWAARYASDFGDFELAMNFLAASAGRRHRNQVLVYLPIVLALLGIGALVWIWQRNEAQIAKAQARITLTYDLVARSAEVRSLQPEKGALLAIEAYRRWPGAHTDRALRDSLALLPSRPLELGGGGPIAFSADGRQLLLAEEDGLRFVDLETPADPPKRVCAECTLRAISPSGTFALLEGPAGELTVVDLASSEKTGEPILAEGKFDEAAVSDDGRVLALRDDSGVRSILRSGRRRPPFVSFAAAERAALSPDARLAAALESEQVTVWNLETGKVVRNFKVGFPVEVMAFSADGGHLVAAARDGRMRVWDLESGLYRLRIEMSNDRAPLRSLHLDRRARFLVVVGLDETTRVFDLRGRMRETTRIPIRAESVAIDPNGTRIALAFDGGVGVYQLLPGGEVAHLVLGDSVVAVAMSRDARRIATAAPAIDLRSTKIAIWRIDSGTREAAASLAGEVRDLAFVGESEALVVGLRRGRVELLDPAPRADTAHEGATPAPTPLVPRAGAGEFSCGRDPQLGGIAPDGTRVALTSADGVACIFDVGSQGQLFQVPFGRGRIAFSRSGRRLSLAGEDGELRLLSTERDDAGSSGTSFGQPADPRVEQGSKLLYPLAAIAIGEDRGRLAFSTWGPGFHVLTEGIDVQGLEHDAEVQALAFGPDDRFVASAGDDATVRVWDLDADEQRREIVRMAQSDPVASLGFSADGASLYLAGGRIVRVLRWRGEDLIDEACHRLTTGRLERSDWNLYLPREEYAVTCPGAETRGLEFSTADQRPAQRVLDEITTYQDRVRAGVTLADAWKLNALCWEGSLWGRAGEVLSACDRAVALDPSSPHYRDSRGLARVLTGDAKGAIEDFRPYLESDASPDDKELRRRWIEDLEAGRDPFEPGDLVKLRTE